MSELTILRHIEAWRFWELIGEKKRDGELKLALVSIGHAYIWPPREPAEATCSYCAAFHRDCHGTAGDNGMPMFNCEGGLYGHKSKSFALKDSVVSDGNVILGKVALWGRITEHEKGYRGQYGYPLSLEGGICWHCGKLIPLDQAYLIVTDEVILVTCSKYFSHVSEFLRTGHPNWRILLNPLNLSYVLSDVWMVKHFKYLKGPGWHLDLAARYGIAMDRMRCAGEEGRYVRTFQKGQNP